MDEQAWRLRETGLEAMDEQAWRLWMNRLGG